MRLTNCIMIDVSGQPMRPCRQISRRSIMKIAAARSWRNQDCLRGYPCAVMRSQTRSFSSCDMNTHCASSTTVRPHPRQTSSIVVEQTATHGVSGREAAGCDMAEFFNFFFVWCFLFLVFFWFVWFVVCVLLLVCLFFC